MKMQLLATALISMIHGQETGSLDPVGHDGCKEDRGGLADDMIHNLVEKQMGVVVGEVTHNQPREKQPDVVGDGMEWKLVEGNQRWDLACVFHN